MRDYKRETESRILFIKKILSDSGATGVVFGNSGGKDSALVGILCKMACDDTVGIIMPCGSKRNYTLDTDDANDVADKFNIETRTVDLTPVKEALLNAIDGVTTLSTMGDANINPRLRMNTLYAVAASENRLVAGTGNRSEAHMGYFTKWGDGAYDFNVIADLTVTEIYEFLEYLEAPSSVIEKAPSAALFEGQTDEQEMGISYANIDKFLLTGEVSADDKLIIDKFHNRSHHKRVMPTVYKAD